MNAIEKIIAQMNEQADSEQTTLEQAEKQRINEQHQEAALRQANDYEKQKARQLAAIDSKYRQLHNRQQVEIRQETLMDKQQFLEMIFKRAAEEMESWPAETALAFAKQAMANVPLTGTARFIPGGKSTGYFTQSWLKSCNQELPYTLEYAAEVIDDQAGFIIDDRGVQYNFIFRNLVEDIRERMAFEIADQLFGKDVGP